MSASPGRPYVGPEVRVRIPLDLLAIIDEAARQCGVSRAAMIRQLLAYGLAA
jgi:metal-responsive CopG/Arc/MetJ family transcriptional regulator